MSEKNIGASSVTSVAIPMSLLRAQLDLVRDAVPYGIAGTVQAISGLTIEAKDLSLPIGALCRIRSRGGQTGTAEVIGFDEGCTLLMPLSGVAGVSRGDRVESVAAAPVVACSTQMLGRVLDGFGKPTDGGGAIPRDAVVRIDNRSPPALSRRNIREPISTSVRAIDGLLTCGRGQRVGIFSGPGVGKSTLMSQIATHCDADVSVIALIGERGREVREFLDHALGPAGLKRSVVIVSNADDPPPLRVRAARVACAIAEYFRDTGKDVMLLMDSLTRLAQAQRQIGLAAREPPATRGFPPSVFAMLPEILERAGQTETGSITGFYTVLVEGDDFNEPIPDAVKGIADGHFWLSRGLANRGHFPAIDVLQSLSRVRGEVCDGEHVRGARKVQALLATYQDIEDLVNIGAYVPGVNPDFDLAVQTRQKVIAYLQQDSKQPTTFVDAKGQLAELIAWVDQVDRAVRTAKQAQSQMNTDKRR